MIRIFNIEISTLLSVSIKKQPFHNIICKSSVTLLKKIALWDDHIKNYDKSAEHNVRIRRIVGDFKENLNRMEEYFFHIQERYNYYATPKIIVLLSQKK